MMHLVTGWVIEGSIVFCQKNILEHSMKFHGGYLKRCLLTHGVSQILLLTQLISEIKNIIITANELFCIIDFFTTGSLDNLQNNYKGEEEKHDCQNC
jgi:hypothetical protein